MKKELRGNFAWSFFFARQTCDFLLVISDCILHIYRLTVCCDVLNVPDGPALSLDINQSAVSPAALAMAILNSSKSRRKARSSPQVPLVIISQPVPAPITGQTSPAPPPPPPEKSDQTSAEATTEVELDMNQLSDPDESSGDVIQSSSDMTSLPVANEPPPSEATGASVTDSEDTPTPEAEQAAVSLHVLPNQKSCNN